MPCVLGSELVRQVTVGRKDKAGVEGLRLEDIWVPE